MIEAIAAAKVENVKAVTVGRGRAKAVARRKPHTTTQTSNKLNHQSIELKK